MTVLWRILLACFMVWGAVVAAPQAQATVYRELDSGNSRFYPLYDHAVHMAALVHAIDAAEPGDSIDMTMYLFTADTRYGLPIMHALRRAANRHVRVRILTSNVSSLYTDRSGHDVPLLADSTLATPMEFIPFGGPRNWLHGMNISDAFHEKIVTISNAVGVKLAFVGGRNIDANDTFVDLAFMVRPLDPFQESVASQLREVVEDRRDTALKLARAASLHPLGIVREQMVARFKKVLLTEAQQDDLNKARRFMLTGPALIPGELRPRKTQVITNDLITYAMLRIFPNTLKGRLNVPDDIAERVHEIILTEKEIYLAAMILSLSPNMVTALKVAMHNGAALKLLTNSLEAARNFVPRGVSYLESLDHIINLLSYKLPTHNFSLLALQPNERSSFTHLKLLNTSRFTVLGSHNFNKQSTTTNSEVAVVIEDPDFSSSILAEMQTRFIPLFKELDCETALKHQAQEGTWINRFINYFIRMFY